MRTLKFLAVEDNDADLYHLRRTLEGMGLVFKMSVLGDGETAARVLSKLSTHDKSRSPDLTFLDLNLPRLSGVEVLKSLPSTSRPPICILTGSDTERDSLMKKFGIRRIAYIVKPVTREMILNCFRSYEHLVQIAEDISAGNAPEPVHR